MALLNPVVSKFTLTQGIPAEVYSCPINKSHAIIDISFFKDNLASDALIAVALATESNPANLTSVDYFIDDIELIGVVNSAELNKVLVGAGERLYLNVLTGPDIVARVSGVEESNPKVLKAGRLAAASISGIAQTQIFASTLPNTSYISASITIFNTSPDSNAQVEAWITSSLTPGASDKVMKITIPYQDTTIIENVLLAPNEKIFIQSNLPNTEYFVNGICIASN
jgi:hypothetical protein